MSSGPYPVSSKLRVFQKHIGFCSMKCKVERQFALEGLICSCVKSFGALGENCSYFASLGKALLRTV